jgi:ABC-type branched-subunit amino acid transport system permease subunit
MTPFAIDTMPPLDPMREHLHRMWSSAAGAWGANVDFIDDRGEEVTRQLLRATAPRPGERVLELAAGPGGPAFTAAALVGPGGEVMQSDVSHEMVAIAAARAAALGLGNVRSRVLDLEHLDVPDASFDVVLCREGLMLVPDPDRAAREMHRVLRPGGRLALTVVGLVVAVSALRVRGVSLAIVTLAGAVAMERFVFNNPTIGGGEAGAPVASPHLLGIDLGTSASFPINASTPPSPVFGFVCVIAAVLLGMLVANLRRSDLGQRMLAVRSNERAAAAAGVDVRGTKLLAFGISSFIAGIAGALYAYDFGSVTADRFGIVTALGFVAFAYLGGITTVSGAIAGGMLVTEGLVIHAVNDWFGVPVSWQLLIAGLALILTIMFNPIGIAGAASHGIRRQLGRGRSTPTTAAVPAETT